MFDPKASLFDNIRNMRGIWFGVVDGAQIDDFVNALSRASLQGRPLYIGLENKPEQLKTAPFLVALNGKNASADSLPDEDLIGQFFDVARTSSACVFWHCDAGGEVLYHHLRSLNKIIVPLASAEVISEAETETVLFRHADANVMAQFLPALNVVELSRFLGSADFVLARPNQEWGNGLIYVSRNADMPRPDSGFLKLSSSSYLKVKQSRGNKSKISIAKRLRKSLPERYGRYDDKDLHAIVDKYYKSGREMGLKSERGLYQWTYLMHASHDQFINQHLMREYLTATSQKSIDDRLDEVFAALILGSHNRGG